MSSSRSSRSSGGGGKQLRQYMLWSEAVSDVV
jgi:hypothetical protein